MLRSHRDAKLMPVGIHFVAENLYLKVYQKNGRIYRSWLFRYSFATRRRDAYLGSIEKVSLAQAKFKAQQYRQILSEGRDPLATAAERHQEEVQKVLDYDRRKEDLKTFFDRILPSIAKAKAWKNDKTLQRWQSTMKAYVLPKIGKKPLIEIKREDIVRVLSPIWETKPSTAQKVRGFLETLFAYAISDGVYSGFNPAVWRGNLDMLLMKPSKIAGSKHYDAIPYQLLPEIVSKHWWPVKTVSEAALIFIILTCSRVGEAAPARWEEIDWKTNTWYCPPERRKDEKPFPHRVPLPTQLVDFLKKFRREFSVGEYIFPGAREGHLHRYGIRMAILRKLGRYTAHGMRSTFRDWAAESGVPEVLAEKSLMHSTGNRVQQAYQRSDLLEQRRPVLQQWADYVFSKVEE